MINLDRFKNFFGEQDKLHDYLGVMLDVNNAYSDRSNALLTIQTLVSEVSALNSRIEKLEAVAFKVFGGDSSRIQKLEELKETMKVTNEAKNQAVREYEHIKVTILTPILLCLLDSRWLINNIYINYRRITRLNLKD